MLSGPVDLLSFVCAMACLTWVVVKVVVSMFGRDFICLSMDRFIVFVLYSVG